MKAIPLGIQSKRLEGAQMTECRPFPSYENAK
jgi:hypothetical protein